MNTLWFVIAAILVLAISSSYASVRYSQHRRGFEFLAGTLLLVSLGMISRNLHLFF
ncbi:hypothetical protein [Methylobacterium planeticum]|uniref:hypothetical protein n=1 Tax=Methylobacterium planeticum TaxID=2615211 RepID=UPI001781E507|nr:hypothetical protein [Methylobacterium planeticum]